MGGSVRPQKNTDNQIIVRQKITELAKKLFVQEQLQVGIIIAENEFNHREHWYLFMSSRRRNGHTLSEVSMEKWAKEWCKENCGKHVHWDNGDRIRPVNDVKGLSSYLTRNLVTEDPDLSDVFIYNKKLLEKCRLKSFSA